jgi:hypothetical protein
MPAISLWPAAKHCQQVPFVKYFASPQITTAFQIPTHAFDAMPQPHQTSYLTPALVCVHCCAVLLKSLQADKSNNITLAAGPSVGSCRQHSAGAGRIRGGAVGQGVHPCRLLLSAHARFPLLHVGCTNYTRVVLLTAGGQEPSGPYCERLFYIRNLHSLRSIWVRNEAVPRCAEKTACIALSRRLPLPSR